MARKSTAFSLGVIPVAALAVSGMFSAILTSDAFAAELRSGPVVSEASAFTAQPRADWYQFGPAATVAAREEISTDQVTLVTLSNGVRVVLKPTRLVDEEVLVNVWIDGGYQTLAPGARAAADIAASMFVRAGVGLKTHDQLVAMFGPVASSIEFDLWNEAFNFGAKARPTELRPLLEMLTAYVNDPGWRFDGLAATKAQAIEYAVGGTSNPHIAFQTQTVGLLTGDPRDIQPSAAQYSDVVAGDLRSAIEDQFKSGAIEIAIVGDLDVEATLAMVAATFGTLPARADAAPNQYAPKFPAHVTTPMEITFHGDPEAQGRMIAWPGRRGLFKSKEEQVISAMFGVMVYRLMDMPIYKSAQFNKGLSAHGGYVLIWAVDRRENLRNFNADVGRIAEDIVARGVTQAEIDRAQAITSNDARSTQARVPNQFWLMTAMNLKGDRANWENARSFISFVEGVTPQQVQSAAARYLHEDKSVSIVANPAKAPESRR